jgi:hypothetical protein
MFKVNSPFSSGSINREEEEVVRPGHARPFLRRKYRFWVRMERTISDCSETYILQTARDK